MTPEAQREDLLYVSNQGRSDMLVFAYPRGKLVGKIHGFGRYPYGVCVDRQQDVWVTSETETDKFTLTQYARGGAHRKDRLRNKWGSGLGCAVDPTNGDLAIVNQSGAHASGPGNITLYSFGSHSATVYQDPEMYVYSSAAYDSAGDLFVIGLGASYAQKFAELPHGTTKFVELKLGRDVMHANQVLWDGEYVVIAEITSGAAGELFRYAISGSIATLHDKISLFGEYDTALWIEGSRIVGGDGQNNVYYWTYPSGKITKSIHGGTISEPRAVAISLGTHVNFVK